MQFLPEQKTEFVLEVTSEQRLEDAVQNTTDPTNEITVDQPVEHKFRNFVVGLMLSAMVAPYLVRATIRFVPLEFTILLTAIVVLKALSISRMPSTNRRQKMWSSVGLLLFAVTPYLLAYFYFKVEIGLANRTGRPLYHVQVKYPVYFSEDSFEIKAFPPDMTIRFDTFVLGQQSFLEVDWADSIDAEPQSLQTEHLQFPVQRGKLISVKIRSDSELVLDSVPVP